MKSPSWPVTVASIALLLPLAASCREGHVEALPNPLDFHAELVGSTAIDRVYLKGTPPVIFPIRGPGAIDGPDKSSFGVFDPTPLGEWDANSPKEIRFEFRPTRRGVHHATYTTMTSTGTMDIIELTGIGASDLRVGDLDHLVDLPDGLDFGPVCRGKSADKTFTVVNHGPRDRDVVLDFDPFNFPFSSADKRVLKTVRRNGGTLDYVVRYSPQNVGPETAGLIVQSFIDHAHRTAVTLKGEGKDCPRGGD